MDLQKERYQWRAAQVEGFKYQQWPFMVQTKETNKILSKFKSIYLLN